mmetsp:Transcript_3741/g.9488  ORF Transcript_3741/g.9488 Transcript_3741/m.9488 type:complete len:216 (-) Transcript_3741:605-1252(-)
MLFRRLSSRDATLSTSGGGCAAFSLRSRMSRSSGSSPSSGLHSSLAPRPGGAFEELDANGDGLAIPGMFKTPGIRLTFFDRCASVPLITPLPLAPASPPTCLVMSLRISSAVSSSFSLASSSRRSSRVASEAPASSQASCGGGADARAAATWRTAALPSRRCSLLTSARAAARSRVTGGSTSGGTSSMSPPPLFRAAGTPQLLAPPSKSSGVRSI